MSDSLDVICYALGEYANKLFNYRMKNDVKYFQLLAVTQSVNLLKHRSWALYKSYRVKGHFAGLSL